MQMYVLSREYISTEYIIIYKCSSQLSPSAAGSQTDDSSVFFFPFNITTALCSSHTMHTRMLLVCPGYLWALPQLTRREQSLGRPACKVATSFSCMLSLTVTRCTGGLAPLLPAPITGLYVSLLLGAGAVPNTKRKSRERSRTAPPK